MLKYVEALVSEKEIPGEKSLVIYISGCKEHCKLCHTPWLQNVNYGDKLIDNYKDLITIYRNYITCVCFLGEGLNGTCEHKEYKEIIEYVHKINLKAALYSGRNTVIEEWMKIFDYIKLGSYKEEQGPIYNKKTNQRLYKKTEQKYNDITNIFWY